MKPVSCRPPIPAILRPRRRHGKRIVGGGQIGSQALTGPRRCVACRRRATRASVRAASTASDASRSRPSRRITTASIRSSAPSATDVVEQRGEPILERRGVVGGGGGDVQARGEAVREIEAEGEVDDVGTQSVGELGALGLVEAGRDPREGGLRGRPEGPEGGVAEGRGLAIEAHVDHLATPPRRAHGHRGAAQEHALQEGAAPGILEQLHPVVGLGHQRGDERADPSGVALERGAQPLGVERTLHDQDAGGVGRRDLGRHRQRGELAERVPPRLPRQGVDVGGELGIARALVDQGAPQRGRAQALHVEVNDDGGGAGHQGERAAHRIARGPTGTPAKDEVPCPEDQPDDANQPEEPEDEACADEGLDVYREGDPRRRGPGRGMAQALAEPAQRQHRQRHADAEEGQSVGAGDSL
jgi:hypothetical protein